jgi:hypothetical protein
MRLQPSYVVELMFAIQAGKIKNLPKRFTMESIEVSIWNTRLIIGQNSYEGVTAFIRQ